MPWPRNRGNVILPPQAMLADIDEFKRNPSVKFEYPHLTDTAPTRYIDKVVNKTATKQSGGQQRPRTGAPARPRRHKTKKRLALPILREWRRHFIGAAILVFLIFKYEGNGMFSQSMDVDLPNFIGLTQAEIQENIRIQNSFFQTEEEYNTEYAAGVVCDQYPRAQTASDPKREGKREDHAHHQQRRGDRHDAGPFRYVPRRSAERL
ncbi:MAG: hypothetical protein ACLR7U_07365 [Ruthenibacterium lactatiformans]